MRVVGLGALCDVNTEDEGEFRVSCVVSEFAVLADGWRITLHDERGFNSWSSSGDPWLHLTVEDLERSVLTTVLPDDDDTEDEHPWDWLVELVHAQGLGTSVEELRGVPYEVVFTERLLARLPTDACSPSPPASTESPASSAPTTQRPRSPTEPQSPSTATKAPSGPKPDQRCLMEHRSGTP